MKQLFFIYYLKITRNVLETKMTDNIETKQRKKINQETKKEINIKAKQ